MDLGKTFSQKDRVICPKIYEIMKRLFFSQKFNQQEEDGKLIWQTYWVKKKGETVNLRSVCHNENN